MTETNIMPDKQAVSIQVPSKDPKAKKQSDDPASEDPDPLADAIEVEASAAVSITPQASV